MSSWRSGSMQGTELSGLGFIPCMAPATWQRLAVNVQYDNDQQMTCTLILVCCTVAAWLNTTNFHVTGQIKGLYFTKVGVHNCNKLELTFNLFGSGKLRDQLLEHTKSLNLTVVYSCLFCV